MESSPEDATVSVDVSPEGDAPAWAVVGGDRLGRYEVVEELGRGGMGVVYRARDPVLDRDVALKLVLHAGVDVAEEARLLREAQAMAQLTHPNVVAVYHVESLPQRGVMLAMELVEGPSLRAWIDEGRSPAEILDAFRQAGLGLAAAHDVGLLHRDFKPANVLVRREDARVMVTDFGLARAADSNDSSAWGTGLASSDRSGSMSGSVTQTGQVLGTPRYMAPEQHRGSKKLTPAVDQYAFCVALWEALTGAPPFSGKGMAVDKAAGPPAWPAPPRVREGIGRVVRRGLAPRPEHRWPDMRTLLGSLETDTGLHRVWWGAATVAFAGVVTWGVAAQPEERRCSGAAAQWDGIWDDARREELRLAFERVDLPFSGAAWQRTVLALDDYTERWSGHYTDACEAGEGPASSASSELDAKMKCLHRAKLQVVSVVELLADADVEVVERAHLLTGGLRPSSQCVDPNRLADEVEPPPPHEMDAVDAIMKQVDEARSAFDAGRVDEARAKVDKARRLLTEVEYEPVRTSVEMAHAGILEAYGDFTGAEAAYQEALRLASVWQQREQMAMAAANLAHIVGAMELRTEDAKRFVEMARQVEIDDPLVNAWRTRLMAGVARASGDSAEAEAAYREALAIEEELLGPDHETVAATRMRLALVVAEQGRLAEAESEMKVGFEVLERKLGRGHPTARDGLNNLAIVIERRGRLVEAEAIYREILDEIVATFGPGHPDESDTRNNLAAVLEQEGRIDEALVEHRRALAIREEALGLRHPDVGVSHLNIGSNLGQQGRYAEAEQETLLALEILEPVVGRDHPHLASAYFNMTRDLLEQSKFEKARETGRRSWEIHERSDLPPGYKAEAAIAYSAALSASNEPTDLERARDLAREARSLCEIDPSWRAECIEEVERWVQKYPGLSTADGPGPSSSPPAPK